MPRATSKKELIDSANAQWDKLWKLVDTLPDAQKEDKAVFENGEIINGS